MSPFARQSRMTWAFYCTWIPVFGPPLTLGVDYYREVKSTPAAIWFVALIAARCLAVLSHLPITATAVTELAPFRSLQRRWYW
jgi:hypothetical protein